MTNSNMALALLSAITLALTSCSSDKGQGAAENVETSKRASTIETHKVSARVIGVDQTAREVLLEGDQGRRFIFRAGPEVRNFNQIHPGDIVRATITEETAIYLNKEGAEPSFNETGTIAVAPLGEKPGAMTSRTRQVT